MKIVGWFEVMDQMSCQGRVTQEELSRGMRMLELHGAAGKKRKVLTAEKVQQRIERTTMIILQAHP